MPKIAKATQQNIRKAAKILREGGLVVYPTETVYGLACDPFNEAAVERLLKAKGREGKPLPVAASSIQKARDIAIFTKKAEKLASRFWPGPLTIVLKHKKPLPQGVTLGTGTIGIRVPDQNVAVRLAELTGGYIVTTSANKSGVPSARTAEEAEAQIGSEVDLILDAGVTPLGQSSTIVDLTQDPPKILREGPIPSKSILEALAT